MTRILLFILALLPALASAQVYDATFATPEHPKPAGILQPGMKSAFWAHAGLWMCPETTREKVGPSPLLPAGHPSAWFNPQERDIDAIIAEADARKADLVILDFEMWASLPATYPRMAELLRYFKSKTNRPACFYPGHLTVGFERDEDVAAWMAGTWKGDAAVIRANIAAAAAVYAECDLYTFDMYAYDEAQLIDGRWAKTLATHAAFRARYYPSREVIPFAGAHYGLVTNNPQIKPEHLAHYLRTVNGESNKGRIVLWGGASQGIKSLARMGMGEAVDPVAVEQAKRIEAAETELARIKGIFKAASETTTTRPAK